MSGRFSFHGMRRIPERGWIAGVCAGVAEYFGWNVRLLRAVLAISFLASGFFPIVAVYCVLWYVLEEGAPGSSYETYAPTGTSPSGRPTTVKDVQARFARLDERLRRIEECVTDHEFELRRELKKLES